MYMMWRYIYKVYGEEGSILFCIAWTCCLNSHNQLQFLRQKNGSCLN